MILKLIINFIKKSSYFICFSLSENNVCDVDDNFIILIILLNISLSISLNVIKLLLK